MTTQEAVEMVLAALKAHQWWARNSDRPRAYAAIDAFWVLEKELERHARIERTYGVMADANEIAKAEVGDASASQKCECGCNYPDHWKEQPDAGAKLTDADDSGECINCGNLQDRLEQVTEDLNYQADQLREELDRLQQFANQVVPMQAEITALEDKIQALESRVLLAEEWRKKAIADRMAAQQELATECYISPLFIRSQRWLEHGDSTCGSEIAGEDALTPPVR